MTVRSLAVLIGALFIGVLVSGCRTLPERPFNSPAFSVTVPEGWQSGEVQEPTKSRDFRKLEIYKKGGLAAADVWIS